MSSSWPIRVATAVFGGALGAGIAPALQRHAHPGQLPGAMTAQGLAVDGPALQLAAVIAGVFIFAIVGEIVARKLAGIRWATVSYCVATASAPLALMTFGNVRHVLLHGVAAAAIVLARRLNPRFTRDDVVLLPTLLATYFAFLDLGFGKTPYPTFLRAAIAVFALRLLISGGQAILRVRTGTVACPPRPGLAFAAAPLAFIFQLQWIAPTLAGALALAWILATAIGGMFIAERIAARALAFVIYPIALTLYALSLVSVTAPLPVDFFEDGHDFTVASEMLHGEKPYRDILPVHGFLADGGLDYLFMKSGADTMGKVLHARFVFTAATVAAIYCLGLAATGSGAMGCLSVLLSLALFPGATFQLRAIPALLSLAGFVAAMRLRSRRWLVAGGVALGFAFLTSVDFAFFSTLVAIVVALRWREPLRAFGSIAAGLLGVLVPALIIFAIAGFALDFFQGTFEILASGNVFVIGPFAIPDCLRSLSAMIWQLPDPQCLSPVLFVIAVVISAAGLAHWRGRRSDAIWYIGLWIAVAALSWVERLHAYYAFALTPFVIATLFHFRRHRTAVASIAIAIALLARPFSHVFDVATMMRRDHGLRPEGWVASHDIPRAAGVVMLPRTVAALSSMKKYLGTLPPNETFYDFSSAALLYYLFDRDDPIPQVEVPFYESADAQRRVIAALERNRNVRAAVITFPDALSKIDGVTNAERVPLVWHYLQNNFRPDFDENGVVIWRRR